MNNLILGTLKSYAINAAVDALSTSLWATVSGTPAVSGSDYRLNNAELRTVQQFIGGQYLFMINVLTAPTAGHVRSWGLKQSSAFGNRGACLFVVSGDKLFARAYDNNGVLIGQQEIAWNAAWTSAITEYIIDVGVNGAVFTVRSAAGASDSTTVSVGFGNKVVNFPCFVSIANSVAENMDVRGVVINSAHRVTTVATL